MISFVVLLIVINHVAFSGSRVAVSLHALHFGADQSAVGLVMASYALCPMLLGVYLGRLADRLGPRRPMLIGTVGVAVALTVPFLAAGLPALYVAGLLLGPSFQLVLVAVQGTAGGIGGSGGRARNYSLVSMGFSAAGLVGPLLAGLAIDHLGHRSAFAVLAGLTVLSLILMWSRPDLLPQGTAAARDGERMRALDLWRTPRLRDAFVASGFVSAGWDLFQFYLPVYGHGVGLSASAIGAVLGVFALATFSIRAVLPAMVKRWSEVEILAAAVFVAALRLASSRSSGRPTRSRQSLFFWVSVWAAASRCRCRSSMPSRRRGGLPNPQACALPSTT